MAEAGCFKQALLVLAHLRKNETFAQVGAAFGVSEATAWRYVDETLEVVAAWASGLHEALVGLGEGDFVIVDGTLIPTDRIRADEPLLVVDALAAAERTRGSLAGAIMHTDHGAQYTSRAIADACRRAGVRQSMSAVGSSSDNAGAESWNATMKRETLQNRKSWSSEREARLELFRWLHRYNTVRRHSRLGHRSPITYEHALDRTSTTLTQAA